MWRRSLVMINTLNTVQNLYYSLHLHSPVLTSVVTATEQQAVARNPAPLTSPSTRWSLTVMVLVVVRGAGVEVPQ